MSYFHWNMDDAFTQILNIFKLDYELFISRILFRFLNAKTGTATRWTLYLRTCTTETTLYIVIIRQQIALMKWITWLVSSSLRSSRWRCKGKMRSQFKSLSESQSCHNILKLFAHEWRDEFVINLGKYVSNCGNFAKF